MAKERSLFTQETIGNAYQKVLVSFRIFSTRRVAASFLEENWEVRATIPERFLGFQERCLNNPEGVVKDKIYQFLLDARMYGIAYTKLRSNFGNTTHGLNSTILDGVGSDLINRIIQKLKDESYQFSPVRRVTISKISGGKRGLDLSNLRDKLVMEVMRVVLEAIYEPRFSDDSFGFRGGRGTHDALRAIRGRFGVARWYIEGDIKGCFDNIDHQHLMKVIEGTILDRKFTRLIWKSLRAGHFEFARYKHSLTGIPQGSVISPILSNIYLHQLDEFVARLKREFDKGK